VARAKLQAQWRRADLEIVVGPGVQIGKDIRLEIEPESVNVLHLGSGTRLGDRVLLQLKGATILLGPEVDIRRDVVLNISGRLEFEGYNQLSWGCVVHCAESIRVERLAGIAEQATIADSSHFHTAPDESFYHNVRTGPVVIGANTWVCAKAVVARGVTIGSCAIVAASSVVTEDVPDSYLASGVPARNVASLRHPWTDG
jgi:acetyltransferase-like isoleucine patch superfamily enzyme